MDGNGWANGPTIRRNVVSANDPDGTVHAPYMGAGDDSLPRPFVGSPTTGFHAQPPVGTHLATLYEVQQRAVAHVSAWDGRTALSPLQAGESAIFAPDGSVLSYASIANPITLYHNASGTVRLTVDRTTGAVNLTCPSGGGFFVNNQQIIVP